MRLFAPSTQALGFQGSNRQARGWTWLLTGRCCVTAIGTPHYSAAVVPPPVTQGSMQMGSVT